MAVITLVGLTASGDMKDSACIVKTTLDKIVLAITSLPVNIVNVKSTQLLPYSKHNIILKPYLRDHGLET